MNAIVGPPQLRPGPRVAIAAEGVNAILGPERENPMATELHDLSIAELAGLIAARKLSPVELTEALIQRVERYDTQTRAFITPTFDLARRQARAAEAEIAAGNNRRSIHRIPV